jgi:hypothetical protein
MRQIFAAMNGVHRARSMKFMKLKHVLFLVTFLPAAIQAEPLSPREIHDQFIIACQTLNLSDISPYIHTSALRAYRETTSAVIKHAVEKYGTDPVVAFFQGTTLQDLQTFSDREYWAFVMASSLQFTADTPAIAIAPRAEFTEGNRFFMVYPTTRSLSTAPEVGSFPTHVAYGFEQEEGSWKMISFFPDMRERTLYSFVRQKQAAKSS